MSQQSPSLVGNLSLGALAGTIATLALSGVSQALSTQENRVSKFQEEWARRGQSATKVAAKRLASAVGSSPSKAQLKATEGAVHFGIGAGSGAVYGAIRPHLPVPGVVKGLGFGATLWLVADEGLSPALGLTPGPGEFPWQAHARGLASHLVFGLATEGVLSLVDLVRGRSASR